MILAYQAFGFVARVLCVLSLENSFEPLALALLGSAFGAS